MRLTVAGEAKVAEETKVEADELRLGVGDAVPEGRGGKESMEEERRTRP